MSYRELRNFKEIMCTLGYPRLISIENFKVPHFELVADILVWLCQRYDKNMEILDEIRTEHDRVAFLKSVAEQLLVKARVKLNIKNLYSSNGFAVRELLKIATLLHDAHRNATLEQEDDDNDSSAIDIGANKKFADIKLTRSLSADITKYGSRLHELLGSHAEAKDSASRALGKNFDVNTLQRQLLEMNSQVAEQTDNLRNMLANLASDEQNMQQRIDKKRSELERHEKRFASLKAVRPAFMDEYERLEVELSAHYSMYVQSWRNLSYLESELDELNATEEERIAENGAHCQAQHTCTLPPVTISAHAAQHRCTRPLAACVRRSASLHPLSISAPASAAQHLCSCVRRSASLLLRPLTASLHLQLPRVRVPPPTALGRSSPVTPQTASSS